MHIKTVAAIDILNAGREQVIIAPRYLPKRLRARVAEGSHLPHIFSKIPLLTFFICPEFYKIDFNVSSTKPIKF